MRLDSEGLSIPIIYGTKFISRLNDWNIGLLLVGEEREYGTSFSTVARMARNFGQQSSVGFITTYGNTLSESGNFLAGVDLNLATSKFMGNKTLNFISHGIKSASEGIKGKDIVWGAAISYPNDLINFMLGYQQIGDNFNAGLGFVPRTNVRESWGSLTFGPRLHILGIRQLSAGGSFDYVTDFNGIMQSKSFSITPNGIRFNSGDRFTYKVSYIYEYLEQDFNIYSDYSIPASEYYWWENVLTFSTSGSRDIYGSFSADILQLNLNLLFSPNTTLYNYLQYDSKSRNAGLQTRFRWILKPGNEILLVWNSGYSTTEENLLMDENALRFKVKYNIRF